MFRLAMVRLLAIGGTEIALIAGGAVVLLFLVWMIAFYNAVRRRQNNIENGFAQLDVQLKRRNDLIPNLVEAVKGYARHERATLEKVIEARNTAAAAASPAEKLTADAALNGLSLRFQGLAEAYPALKADGQFIALQKELSETEAKIGHFRQFYNDAVLLYNRKISPFPNNLTAALLRFKKQAYLEAAAEERETVKVNFD